MSDEVTRMTHQEAISYLEGKYCLSCGDDYWIHLINAQYCPECGHAYVCQECGACSYYRDNPEELDGSIAICDGFDDGCWLCDAEKEEQEELGV